MRWVPSAGHPTNRQSATVCVEERGGRGTTTREAPERIPPPPARTGAALLHQHEHSPICVRAKLQIIVSIFANDLHWCSAAVNPHADCDGVYLRVHRYLIF